MNWYMAKLVFRIICGNGDHAAQFDEQLRLIEATDEKDAFLKAQKVGDKEQEIFFNQQQKLVQWQFINVSELYKISELIDGAELYSRVQEADNADLYVQMVNKKAEHIQFNNTHKWLQFL